MLDGQQRDATLLLRQYDGTWRVDPSTALGRLTVAAPVGTGFMIGGRAFPLSSVALAPAGFRNVGRSVQARTYRFGGADLEVAYSRGRAGAGDSGVRPAGPLADLAEVVTVVADASPDAGLSPDARPAVAGPAHPERGTARGRAVASAA